jgi:ATP-dependent Lon protease
VLFVEASRMQGGGSLTLTGHLGDVMKESARTALSWFRAHATRYGVDPAFYKDSELHLHVPSGAIPKDGPSAGVTMVTALASTLSGRPVRGDVAMTGEITLSGRVLPVGGIKEKVLAARRHGITEVILPRQNEKNIKEDLTEDLRRELTIHYVAHMEEVLAIALQPSSAQTKVGIVDALSGRRCSERAKVQIIPSPTTVFMSTISPRRTISRASRRSNTCASMSSSSSSAAADVGSSRFDSR